MIELRRVLLVDDDPDFLVAMRMQLKGRYVTFSANSILEAIEILKTNDVDLVLLDVSLGDENGLDGIRKIHNVHPSVGIAMLSGERDVDIVVEAIRNGAVDYLTKPVMLDKVIEAVEKAVATRVVQEKCEALMQSHKSGKGDREIVHRSACMNDLLLNAGQANGHDANILITGETGTGKELLARYINKNEGNLRRPFIAVNCAAIPENLLEAELFGHEACAFTGATRRRIGKFELADGGDIFLDEVSTMHLDLQVKLLRVLQEKEFCRLGSNTPIKANFRVIAACNQSLEHMIEKGTFRIDLYHRLRVMQFDMPPLRNRVEDIPILVDHFLRKFNVTGVEKKISEAAMSKLLEYSWPGNVRELANVIQSLVIMTQGTVIDESSFPAWVMNGCKQNISVQKTTSLPVLPMETDIPESMSLKEFSLKVERDFIKNVLKRNEGDKSKAATELGIGRTTLYIKMRELGLM